MSIRRQSPFTDPTANLKSNVNPYVDKLVSAQQVENVLPLIYGEDLRAMPRQWRTHFAPSAPSSKLIVEIGCHLGKTLTTLAREFPQHRFVGMDITFKRVVISAEKLATANLTNAATVLADARALPELFAPGELDGVVIFFPDPWPKKRHRKNRLLSEKFCQDLHQTLAPGGFIWLKTDVESYFEDAQINLEKAFFSRSVNAFVGDKHAGFYSTFEERFKAQNLPTFEGTWQKL